MKIIYTQLTHDYHFDEYKPQKYKITNLDVEV